MSHSLGFALQAEFNKQLCPSGNLWGWNSSTELVMHRNVSLGSESLSRVAQEPGQWHRGQTWCPVLGAVQVGERAEHPPGCILLLEPLSPVSQCGSPAHPSGCPGWFQTLTGAQEPWHRAQNPCALDFNPWEKITTLT